MIAIPKLRTKFVSLPKVYISLKAMRDYAAAARASAGRVLRSSATQVATTSTVAAKKTKASAKRQKSKLRPYFVNAWLAPYVLLAVAVPQVALLWRPVLGVYATAASLLLLLALSHWSEKARKLAISAAILPTTMLVGISLPQQDAFARSAVFYDAILLLALVYGYVFTMNEPRSATSLGKKYIILLPLMVVIGQALGALGFGMLRGQFPYHGTSLSLVASTAVVFAIAEELLFRGLIQQQAMKVVHPIMAATIAALSYAAVFAAHGSYLPVVFALISGAILSTVYYFKQNLILTTTTNIAMKLVFVGLMATFVLR
jgi:membrane protease YdiL (CAAX protease family)